MAAKKKSKSRYADEVQKFAAGETVIVVRQSVMWQGYAGVVVSFRDGLHLVKLDTLPNGKPSSPFHAEMRGEELDTWL